MENETGLYESPISKAFNFLVLMIIAILVLIVVVYNYTYKAEDEDAANLKVYTQGELAGKVGSGLADYIWRQDYGDIVGIDIIYDTGTRAEVEITYDTSDCYTFIYDDTGYSNYLNNQLKKLDLATIYEENDAVLRQYHIINAEDYDISYYTYEQGIGWTATVENRNGDEYYLTIGEDYIITIKERKE